MRGLSALGLASLMLPWLATLAAWPAATAPRGTRPNLDVSLDSPQGGSQALAAPGKPIVLRVKSAETPWAEFAALTGARPEARLVRVMPAGCEPPEDGVQTLLASPAALEELLGPAPHTLPITVVFDVDGDPCRTFRREVPAADLVAFLELIAGEPAFRSLLVSSGRLALSQGLYRPAQQLFLRALEIDDSSTAACDGLAHSTIYLEQGAHAEEAYARSVRIDPDYALGHFNLGLTRVGLGRPEDAIARAARAEPSDAEALLKHGQLLGQLRRLEEARTSLRMVERLLQER